MKRLMFPTLMTSLVMMSLVMVTSGGLLELETAIKKEVRDAMQQIAALDEVLGELGHFVQETMMEAKDMTKNTMPVQLCFLEDTSMSTSREQTCQYGGVCNMEDIVTVSSYNLAFCEPNSHIHPGIQFREWWFPMQKICLGKDVLTGTIEDECSEQEEKTFCYIDKMCDYLEEAVLEMDGVVAEEVMANLRAECDLALMVCVKTKKKDENEILLHCMHEEMTEEMVCHGLNDEVKMGCKDSLKKCRDINNPIDKEECVLEEIEKACLAETETAEFDQCADVYAVIKCSRLPKASDERKQCKQDAKTYLSDKHTPGPN